MIIKKKRRRKKNKSKKNKKAKGKKKSKKNKKNKERKMNVIEEHERKYGNLATHPNMSTWYVENKKTEKKVKNTSTFNEY